MSQYLKSHGSVMGAVIAPVARLIDLSPDGKLVAGLLGMVAAVTADISVLLVAVLLLSSSIDWWFGRAAAKKRGVFDVGVSAWGLHSKIAGVLLVVVLRLVEVVLNQAGVPDPHGVLAVATAAALIYQDLESIDLHRQTLGGRPIPILTSVLKVGRRLAESLLPVDTGDRGEERP